MIFVASLGRAGSSMVMQALHAAGLDCYGSENWPSFEVGNGETHHCAESMHKHEAAKLVDPLAMLSIPELARIIRPGDHVIWIDRINRRQQALSQLDLVSQQLRITPFENADLTAMASNIWKLRKKTLAAIRKCSTSVDIVLFESLISSYGGWDAVKLVAPTLKDHTIFKTVVNRSPRCQHFQVESYLLRHAGQFRQEVSL